MSDVVVVVVVVVVVLGVSAAHVIIILLPTPPLLSCRHLSYSARPHNNETAFITVHIIFLTLDREK